MLYGWCYYRIIFITKKNYTILHIKYNHNYYNHIKKNDIYIHTLSNISNEDIFSNYSEAFASKLLENLENMFVRCYTQSDMFSMSNYTLVLYPPQNGSNNREQMDKSMLQQICIIYLFLLCFVEQSRYVCSDSVSRIIYIVNFTQTHTRKQTNIPCSIHIFNSNVRRYSKFILERKNNHVFL